MNTVSIIFAVGSVLSLVLLLISAVLSGITKKKNGEPFVLPTAFAWLQSEAVGLIGLVFFVSFGILAAHAAIDKCEACNRTVTSAYCIYCGEKNEGYVDNVSPLAGKNICPECQLPCDTSYCGDCGTQTTFVEK